MSEFNKIDFDDEISAINKERLERLKAKLKDQGEADIQIELLYGSPTEQILKYIQENTVSLVIMGSQGRGFIKEIFLGSVSHNVARHAAASTLLIPALR